MAIQNEVDYDDDNDATIGKELEIVKSSSRALISDLALHERIKDRVPKTTISSTNWAIRAWECYVTVVTLREHSRTFELPIVFT